MATEEDLRSAALALPGTTEGTWYGTAGYRVADRGFLRLRTEDDGALVLPVTDLGEKEALLTARPDAFFTTPHYDGHAVVLVRLPAIEPTELAELVTEAWRLRASARLRRTLDEG